jgi:TonB family protein
LPAELPASFHEIVSRCLAADPRHRPTVSQLQAWLDGAPLAVPVIAEPASRLVIRVELPSEQRWQAAPVAERERERERRSALPWVLGAVALVVLVVGGWFAYRTASTGSPTTEPVVAAPAPTQTPTPTPAPAPQPPAIQAPPAAAEPSPASRAASAYTPVDEVMPNVSRGALDTITGTVRVAVRVTVDRDGGVVAATAEVPGPSRYFERRSLEAARKWTFAPVDADGQRHLLLRFNFRQSGVTSSAEPLP